ncbi:LCP family protein [Salsipaludibacter albus]|uniref:LCP family protein n=1 Tax=Salsipaludibacter albus TaxID=2849650 RepID=UPI001EE46251|nr:LCP family protein [Salsipaludibacter albus]
MRIVVAGLAGLLALGAASADVVTRTASLLIPDMALTALGSTDHPDEAVPVAEQPVADGPLPTTVPSDVPEVTEVQDILLVGVDSREGLTHDQMAEMEAFDHGGALTDTILWVQYLPQTQAVRMLAFPRDIAVETEDHGLQKINALHPLDGANALVEAVEELVGDDLDHYVEVDLAGLVTLTDAVGGVEVCLDEPMDDPTVGTIDEGCSVLDGIDAGRFVRARKVSDSFGAGTLGRAARQQYFLRQALGEVLTAGTLANPAKLRALVGVASRSVVVDDGLTLGQMYGLADVFRSIEPEQIESAIVPVVAFSSDGLYYERLDDGAEDVFDAIRFHTPFPDDVLSDDAAETNDDVEGDLDGFGSSGPVTVPSDGASEPVGSTSEDPTSSSGADGDFLP